MFFIHIPKSAGTYISNVLGCQKNHAPVKLRYNPPYLICLRNPFSTYISLYFFLRQKKNSFQIQRIAKRMSLNQFIQTIVNSNTLTKEITRLTPLFDIQGDYGLYTHFLMYLANPNDYSDVKMVLSVIQDTFHIIRFTNIQEDLTLFNPQLSLPREQINKSIWAINEVLTDDTIHLVLIKDRLVIEHFFPDWITTCEAINDRLFSLNTNILTI